AHAHQAGDNAGPVVEMVAAREDQLVLGIGSLDDAAARDVDLALVQSTRPRRNAQKVFARDHQAATLLQCNMSFRAARLSRAATKLHAKWPEDGLSSYRFNLLKRPGVDQVAPPTPHSSHGLPTTADIGSWCHAKPIKSARKAPDP